MRIDSRSSAEDRFGRVFSHLSLITAYARRRGARDADEIAAEVMAIAWRRLADVPRDDPRPWLIGTARNLLLAERRKAMSALQGLDGVDVAATDELAAPLLDIDGELEAALRRLSPRDREALLLVAWEDLTPASAAESLGISAVAFRVRLHRARGRLKHELAASQPPAKLASRRHSWEQI